MYVKPGHDQVTPSKRGADREEVRLRALMRHPIAHTTMSALSSRHIAAYRDERLKGVSANTVNKALNHLGHVIETARRERGVALPETRCVWFDAHAAVLREIEG